MTPQEILDQAERLRLEEQDIDDPSMSNYRQVLAQYRQILNDHSVLIRELARWAVFEEDRKHPPSNN